MNNRIFEIIQDLNGRVGLQWTEADKEELAELIVRECMSVADLPKNSSGQWDHLESSEVIARHFGVE